MKRFTLALAFFVFLLICYWLWPFLGLRSLAADVQARDAVALSEDVDFIRLRRSVTEQIIAAYFRVTGKAKKLSPFENIIATGIGTSIADPLVAQLINPENLLALFSAQTVPTDMGNISFNIGKVPSLSLGSVVAAWLSAEYGIGQFSIGVPVSAQSADQFRIRMELLQWRWKVTGLDLPENLRDRVARELAKKFP